MIYKFRRDGLASRLWHAWQVPFIYRLHKVPIDVIWEPSYECHISLERILKPKSFYNIKDYDKNDFSEASCPFLFFGGKINEELIDVTAIENLLYATGNGSQEPLWLKTEYYSEILHPTDEVQDKFNKIKHKYDISSDVISLHIRGFEPTESGEASREATREKITKKINQYAEVVNEVLLDDRNQRFLIASDDPEIEDRFISLFPRNFFKIEEDKKPTNIKGLRFCHRDTESVMQSFVLLLTLSETTYSSQFIPFEEISTNGSFFTRFPPIIQKIREFKEFL